MQNVCIKSSVFREKNKIIANMYYNIDDLVKDRQLKDVYLNLTQPYV